MEVESPKLISNIGLNNTNNNSECEVAQLSQSIISERLDQDSFDVLENTKNKANDEICSSTVQETSQTFVIDDPIPTSSNDNDYINPKIEFCFFGEESDSVLTNEKSDNYNQCDNRASFETECESLFSEDKHTVKSEINENSFMKSGETSESCYAPLVNIASDTKVVIDNNDIIEFYHDSQWNPKNSGTDTYKNNINGILTLSENTFLEERESVKNEIIEEVTFVSSVHNSSGSSSKSSIVHLGEEGNCGMSDKPNIEFFDDSSSNVNKSNSNIDTCVSTQLNNSSSNHPLMKVNTKLEEENKENYIFHNLENINNNLGGQEKVQDVEGNNIGNQIESDHHISSLNFLNNITQVTENSDTISSSSDAKDKVGGSKDEHTIVTRDGQEVDSNDKLHITEELNIDLSITPESKHHPNVEKIGVEKEYEVITEVQDKSNSSTNYDCPSNVILNELKEVYVDVPESKNKYSSNPTEEIVSIIKRTPSNVSESGKKTVLKKEHTENPLDPLSEAALKEIKSSPNQRNQPHRSSTHRVKFTEELPTKSTLQYNPAITSSPSQSNSSKMGGTGETTPGHSRHSGEQTSLPVKIGSEHQETSEDLQNAPPHVMITEEFPSKEDRAFGTKIESSYEGWDNPFRPEGEISHDAEELLRLWRLGKLEEQSRKNSQSNNNNDKNVAPKGTPKHTNGQVANSNLDDASEPLLKQNGEHQNGVTPSGSTPHTSTFEVKRETVGVHQPSQHVTINDMKGDISEPPKKKTDGCCSIM